MTIHFRIYTYSDKRRLIPETACDSGLVCIDDNSSNLHHEVTCFHCLKLLMQLKQERAA